MIRMYCMRYDTIGCVFILGGVHEARLKEQGIQRGGKYIYEYSPNKGVWLVHSNSVTLKLLHDFIC